MAKLTAERLKQQYLYGTTGVNDLSFSVEDDSFVVLGGDESGKTSLLRVLSGKEPPFSGSVLYDGVPLDAIALQDRKLVYVRERGGIFRCRSVFYNCAYPLKLRKFPDSEISERVASALARVGLSGSEKRRAGRLSPLDSARLKLARCFLRAADFYLIDCVQKGLSDRDRGAVLDLLTEIKTLPGVKIFATDRYREAERLADTGAVLYYGITEQTGSVAEFYEKPETPEVFRLTHGELSTEEGTLNAAAGEILTETKKIRLDRAKIKLRAASAPEGGEDEKNGLPVLIVTAPDGVTKIYTARDEKLIYFD